MEGVVNCFPPSPFITKNRMKVKGIGLQLDATGWCIVILIIASIVLGAIFVMRDSSKVASTKLELGQIQNAVIQYEGLRIDGQPPASLNILLNSPSISSSDSIDGLQHDAFLPTTNTRWAAGQVTDIWNQGYTYTVNADKTGTISSVGSGKTISINF